MIRYSLHMVLRCITEAPFLTLPHIHILIHSNGHGQRPPNRRTPHPPHHHLIISLNKRGVPVLLTSLTIVLASVLDIVLVISLLLCIFQIISLNSPIINTHHSSHTGSSWWCGKQEWWVRSGYRWWQGSGIKS